MELDDRIFVNIELSETDLFSDETLVKIPTSSCQVFNNATGNWIDFPNDGLGMAFAGSQVRFKLDEFNTLYTNGRYNWQSELSVGSYNPIKL